MERQIKFRAKHIKNGAWLYGDLLQSNEGSVYIGVHGQYIDDGMHFNDMYDETCYIDEDTIGQFVGITDEYGKEVFEGDVLEADYKYDSLGYNGGVDPDNDCICYGVVEFDNDALQWVLNIYKAEYPISKQIEEDGCSLFPLQIFGHEYGYDNCNLKIIGNIHDNPSLISDKQ
jgi:uncharacterized phage protein (TIGR01671 family)